MTIKTESGSSPYASWVNVARLVWMVLSIAAIVLFFIGFSNRQNAPLPSCTTPDAVCPFYVVSQEDTQVAQQMGLPVSLALATGLIPFLLVRLGYVLVAVLIFWRKSDDWVALMFSLSLMVGILEEVVDSTGAFQPIAALLLGISGGLFILVPFVFPNGRFEPRWTRPIALLLAVLSVITIIAPQQVLNVGLWSAVSVLAIYAIIFRYQRISNAVERQQTKWAATGLLVIFVTLLFSFGVGSVFPASQPTSGRVVFLLINGFLYPGSGVAMLVFFAIAILRYRLWDIDILIRRTLQYSLLTGLLALVYFGSIILLQNLFSTISNQQSEISIVLSTLTIAALFTPLRRQVQDFIDRRFYRKKYNAEQALAQFAAVARDEVDMDKLTAALIGVVQETMQPERVSLWLKDSNAKPQRREGAKEK